MGRGEVKSLSGCCAGLRKRSLSPGIHTRMQRDGIVGNSCNCQGLHFNPVPEEQAGLAACFLSTPVIFELSRKYLGRLPPMATCFWKEPWRTKTGYISAGATDGDHRKVGEWILTHTVPCSTLLRPSTPSPQHRSPKGIRLCCG